MGNSVNHPRHTPLSGPSWTSRLFNRCIGGSRAKRFLSRLPEEIQIHIYDKIPLPILLDQFESQCSRYKERFKKACEMSGLFPEDLLYNPDYIWEFKRFLRMLRNKSMPSSYKRRIRYDDFLSVGNGNAVRGNQGDVNHISVRDDAPNTEFHFTCEPKRLVVKYDNFFVICWRIINQKIYFVGGNRWEGWKVLYVKRYDLVTRETFHIGEMPMEVEHATYNNFDVSNNTVLFSAEGDRIVWIFTINGERVEERKITGEILLELRGYGYVMFHFEEDGAHKIVKTLSLVDGEVVERFVQRSRWITARHMNGQFFYLLDDTKRRVWYQEMPGAASICVHEDSRPLYVERFLFSPADLNTWMRGNPHGPTHPRLRYRSQETGRPFLH